MPNGSRGMSFEVSPTGVLKGIGRNKKSRVDVALTRLRLTPLHFKSLYDLNV